MRRIHAFVRRTLSRLLEAESAERDVWFRGDYRQAAITLSFAARGRKNPADLASRVMFGLPLDRVWESICERRKAQLGRYYEQFFDEHGQWKPDPAWSGVPKKPAQSVRWDESRVERKAVADRARWRYLLNQS